MADFPPSYAPLNFCRSCGVDFTSTRAFDLHRVGRHSALWSPDFEQGRRCLGVDELAGVGLEPRAGVLGVPRWGLVVTEAQKVRWAGLREAA